TTIPSGSVPATYGEGPSHGVNSDVLGKFAKLGYYLNVDHIDSDGLWKDRYTRKESFYGKLKLALANDIALGLTYSDSFPRYKTSEYEAGNSIQYIRNHTSFGALNLDVPIGESLHLHASLNRFIMDYTDNRNTFTTNAYNWHQMWAEAATEGSVRLSWEGEKHSAVLGA
nr:hypothetical protein [Desulfobulbaceae bacterium]